MVNARLGKPPIDLQAQILEQVGAWMPEVGKPENADPDDYESIMRFSADAFVRSAKITGTMWLDYSPESVMRLDDWISEQWPPRPRKGTYESMVPSIGAYVGEVLIRQTGAHWVKSTKDGFGVELQDVAWPMNKVAKRFELGPDHSIGHFYREIAAHWLSGSDAVPTTWRPTPEKRGFFGRRKG